MNLAELIERLNDLLSQQGNREVVILTDDGYLQKIWRVDFYPTDQTIRIEI